LGHRKERSGLARTFTHRAYNGRFYIDLPGKYEFSLISDDGSRLYIDGRLVINNDGLHASFAKTGDIKLSGGIHTIRVSYFQGPNPCVELQLGVKPPGSTRSKYFSTDDFSPPANPADWKYGSPDDIKDPPDPNTGRRRLRDELKKTDR
jgi:hypothetical protein